MNVTGKSRKRVGPLYPFSRWMGAAHLVPVALFLVFLTIPVAPILPDSSTEPQAISSTPVAGETSSSSNGNQDSNGTSGPADPIATGDPMRATFALHAIQRRRPAGSPWSVPEVSDSWGNAVLLPDGRLLTDLDLVRDSIHVDLYNPRTGGRGAARVLFRGSDCGLALLESEDKTLLQDSDSVPGTGKQPSMGSLLRITGVDFDSGALLQEVAYITKISTELPDDSDAGSIPLYFGRERGEADSHFSGGPVITPDGFLGIYHRSRGRKDADFYAIPDSVIRHFLEDVQDGNYDGFPSPGFTYTVVLNPDMRDYYGLAAGEGAIVVDRVDYGSPAYGHVRPGDLIVSLNSLPIDPAGRVALQKESVPVERYISFLQKGELKMDAIRGSSKIELQFPVKARTLEALRRKSVLDSRRYFMGAGLVFQELDYDLIHETSYGRNALLRHLYEDGLEENLNLRADEAVVLTAILEDAINTEFGRFLGGVVESLNGHPVRNLEEFNRLWRSSEDRYLVIAFRDLSMKLVLERGQIKDAEDRIAKKYRPQEYGRVR